MKRPTKVIVTLVVIAGVWAFATVALGTWFFNERSNVSDHLELGGPGKAVSTFAMCLRAGHRGDVLACVVNEAEQQRLAAGFVDLVNTGVDADDLTQLPPLDIENADVQIDGDTATVTPPAVEGVDRAAAFVVQRDGDAWRIDLLATLDLSADEADELATRLRSAAMTVE
ncbi:MAG: hypothetical protein AAF561_11795 [Planctomycetota bacterium]